MCGRYYARGHYALNCPQFFRESSPQRHFETADNMELVKRVRSGLFAQPRRNLWRLQCKRQTWRRRWRHQRRRSRHETKRRRTASRCRARLLTNGARTSQNWIRGTSLTTTTTSSTGQVPFRDTTFNNLYLICPKFCLCLRLCPGRLPDHCWIHSGRPGVYSGAMPASAAQGRRSGAPDSLRPDPPRAKLYNRR